MDRIINLELLSHPINWLVVGAILAVMTAVLHLVWRDEAPS